MTEVAVVGSGYWGKNLVRNFYELGVLKLVCDKNETLREQFKEQYPELDVCSAYTDVIGSADIKAVVIATPAETHYALAKEALLAGKHVFVEKPVALMQEEGQELVELADENKLILMVGHILHYHPAVRKLKELIDTGELGKMVKLELRRISSGVSRPMISQ
jgi:UDP-2-acetamido-3-amino-2,3-dideoxy-glucuronate N-acetyltransferase